MADGEKVGYHKGALESLINEKSELSRILQIVNSLIERHAKELQNAGVDVEGFVNDMMEKQKARAQQAAERQQSQQAGNERQQRRRQGSGERQSGGSGVKPEGRFRSSGEEEEEDVEIDDWIED